MMEDFVYAPRFCRSLPAFFLFAETGLRDWKHVDVIGTFVGALFMPTSLPQIIGEIKQRRAKARKGEKG